MKYDDPKEIFSRRLAQARRMRGLSLRDLSKATGNRVSYNALHRYEKAEMMPGDEVLLPIADVLGKPLDFFFQPFGAKLEGLQFRKRHRLGAKAEEAIRAQATDYIERYLEIEKILGLSQDFQDPLNGSRIREPEDVEKVAETVRGTWNIGLDPLPNVLETLENCGIKIFEVDAPDSFDGFSGWADGHPVVVLSRMLDGDVPRKRFTALHEFAHLLLHPRIDAPEEGQEKYCHRFAGAMLMPRKAFENDWGGYRHRLVLDELVDLKRRYGISIAAIIHRAHDLGLIEKALYRRFWIIFKSKGWHRREPGEYQGAEKSNRFEQLVARAVAEEVISMGKGSALLNIAIEGLRQKLGEFL